MTTPVSLTIRRVGAMRDYELWHRQYDDPTSDLSWRLRTVQGYMRDALDRYPGPIRILSSCSGDGRDVLEVLAQRIDSGRVHAVLVEAHPEIADRARRSAATLLWSRARSGGDLNDLVRARLAAAGFTELDYATLDTGTWPAVGVVRYDGPPVPLPTGQQLFTFRR